MTNLNNAIAIIILLAVIVVVVYETLEVPGYLLISLLVSPTSLQSGISNISSCHSSLFQIFQKLPFTHTDGVKSQRKIFPWNLETVCGPPDILISDFQPLEL